MTMMTQRYWPRSIMNSAIWTIRITASGKVCSEWSRASIITGVCSSNIASRLKKWTKTTLLCTWRKMKGSKTQSFFGSGGRHSLWGTKIWTLIPWEMIIKILKVRRKLSSRLIKDLNSRTKWKVSIHFLINSKITIVQDL